MIHDLNQFGLHVKAKATSTLNNMKKADLIKYIRELEHNYNVTVDFNEQQARNIEAMLKEKRNEDRTEIKVYVVIDSGACEGVHETNILGIFSNKEKAKEAFDKAIEYLKEDIGTYDEETDEIKIDEEWIVTERENMFHVYDKSYGSHEFETIWIAEEKVK